MQKLNVEVKSNKNTTVIRLIGALTEWADIIEPKNLPKTPVVIDFAKLEYLNSIGIGVWVHWIEKLIQHIPAENIKLANCTKAVVTQINNVIGFKPKGIEVLSLEVPFYCEDCDISANSKYVLNKHYFTNPPKVEMQILNCPQCNHPMEMDTIEKTYFRFTKND